MLVPLFECCHRAIRADATMHTPKTPFAAKPLPPDRRAGKGVFARAVGSFVPKLAAKAFEQYGFHSAEIMTAWTAATVDLQNALRRWPEAALDRQRLPHPIIGMLTVREILGFTVYHTAHHLRRIAERAGGDGQSGLR